MRRRASVEAVGAALLAALGLPGGCGGSASGGAPTTCAQHPCASPAPLVVDTGYDTCLGGTLRRRAIVDCPSFLPRASGGACAAPDGGISAQCASDKDCGSNNYCVNTGTTCQCSIGCVRDANCGPGGICLCGDPVGTCHAASCASDGSCARGCDCIAPGSHTGSTGAFTCQTPGDTCTSDRDCMGGPTTWSHLRSALTSCGYTQTSICAPQSYGDIWATGVPPGLTCQPEISCRTGRPFLVHGTERVADCVANGDWLSSSVVPDVRGLSDSVRSRVAGHWARVGVMEHASIAAFARFALHLLAVGAPPDLVSLSQQAMGDETEHARLAFSLASAYAGHAMGPGELALALAQMMSLAPGQDADRDLDPFGVLSAAHRAELRRAAASQVIGPCARALNAGSSATKAGVRSIGEQSIDDPLAERYLSRR